MLRLRSVAPPVLITALIFRIHKLRMHHEAVILCNDVLVVCRADQSVFFRDFMLRDELRAHMWRPKVSWSVTLAAKSLLQLARMEHIYQGLGCTLPCQYNFQLRFSIDKDLHAFVECALAPADMRVERAEEEVQEVGLT